jgi:hypothetical protein
LRRCNATGKSAQGQQNVISQRLLRHDAFLLPVIGKITYAGAYCRPRRSDRCLLARNLDPATGKWRIAEQSATKRRFARAFKPGDAEDFARPDVEIDVVENGVAAAAHADEHLARLGG